MYVWMDECMYLCMYGCMCGWMDGCMLCMSDFHNLPSLILSFPIPIHNIKEKESIPTNNRPTYTDGSGLKNHDRVQT